MASDLVIVDEEEPNNERKHTPHLGMIFDSLEEAYECYNRYGRKMGFNIKNHSKGKINKDNGMLTSKLFTCSKEGFRRPDKRDHLTKNPRAETRTGCGALMGVKLSKTSKRYEIYRFVAEHNHEFVRSDLVQRKISVTQSEQIELTNDSERDYVDQNNSVVMDKISDVLKQTDMKKYSLRKAMMTFLLEWKDLETHVDSTQKCLQQLYSHQKCRENHLNTVQESVTQSSNELDTIRKSIESRFQEVEQKENEFLLFQQKWIREFESKEKNMGLILKEVKLREEGMNEQEKLIKRYLEEVKTERKKIEDMQKSVDEKRVIQKCTEDVLGDIRSMEKGFKARFEEIKSEKEKLKAREEELELREKYLNSIHKLKPPPFKTGNTSDIHVEHSKKDFETRASVKRKVSELGSLEICHNN